MTRMRSLTRSFGVTAMMIALGLIEPNKRDDRYSEAGEPVGEVK